MIKKLLYIFIPLIFISFSQNVKAQENLTIKKYYSSKDNYFISSDLSVSNEYLNNLFTSDIEKYQTVNTYENNRYSYSYVNQMINNLKNDYFKDYTDLYDSWLLHNDNTYNGNYILFFNNDDSYMYAYNEYNNNFQLGIHCNNCVKYNPYNGSYTDLNSYNFNYNNIVVQNNIVTATNPGKFSYSTLLVNSNDTIKNLFGHDSLPKISYSLKPIYKDGYLSSYGIKVVSSVVDDTLYNYQYAIKDNIDDNLKWVDLYNNNFINNEFSYVAKKPIYFYFIILDKSNNNVIDSITITLNFDIISPQYDIIFNQSKFYLNGTNYIDRVGLSITYKSSIDGLKYQYQYVNDGSSLSDNNWIDTETDIYKVYNENGVLYARILDNNNNVLYSATFSNTLIGKQDILQNPNNFPLYNKVQKVLNFNNGSISDLVLMPVKVLMFMSDSLNNNVCNDYSFGSLLGHELKLPCINIKSLVGETIYNFYDLVCSFFISLGIIKLLKNIYLRFMKLEIKDIDSKGGIF